MLDICECGTSLLPRPPGLIIKKEGVFTEKIVGYKYSEFNTKCINCGKIHTYPEKFEKA